MKKAYIVGILLFCIWLMYQFPHVMLNPGDLVKGHQKLNAKCLDCHQPFMGVSNEKCISCHKLSDIGKDTLHLNDTLSASGKILFHHELSGQKCTSCHSDHQGILPVMAISSFDHNLLSKNTISKCISCHNKPSGNLHQQLSENCKSCHTTEGWKPEGKFDHKLVAAGERSKCESCHKKPDDSYHKLFKENCNKCHSTEKWVPSTFDHAKYFQLDRDHNVTCITCHANNNFSAYTCYGCHEHSKSKLMKEHNEAGIFNFDNCVSCHKSANEHDIIRSDKTGKALNKRELNAVKNYINSDNKNEGNGKEEKNDD